MSQSCLSHVVKLRLHCTPTSSWSCSEHQVRRRCIAGFDLHADRTIPARNLSHPIVLLKSVCPFSIASFTPIFLGGKQKTLKLRFGRFAQRIGVRDRLAGSGVKIMVWVGGWVNQAYSRLSTTHGHITDCKLDSVVIAGVCVWVWSGLDIKVYPWRGVSVG